MSEIKAATSAYQLFQREKHAEVKASLEVGALSRGTYAGHEVKMLLRPVFTFRRFFDGSANLLFTVCIMLYHRCDIVVTGPAGRVRWHPLT